MKCSGTSACVFSVRLTRWKSTWRRRPLLLSRETAGMRAGMPSPSRPSSDRSVVFPQRRYDSWKECRSVCTGVESLWPPKITPGSVPSRRSPATFFPSTVRGRTASFWASATANSPSRTCGEVIISGRRREIQDEPHRRAQHERLRAGKLVEPDAPHEHALEILDQAHLANEGRCGLDRRRARVGACRAVGLDGRGVLKTNAEQRASRDRDGLSARAAKRGRDRYLIGRPPVRARRRARAELEDEAVEAGAVRDPDGGELYLIRRRSTDQGRARGCRAASRAGRGAWAWAGRGRRRRWRSCR